MLDTFGPLTPALLLLMIYGLVEFAKRLGLGGNWPMVVSMIVGVLFGVLFQLAEMYDWMNPWFQIAVYGLATGLAACGLFDISKRLGAAKPAAKNGP